MRPVVSYYGGKQKMSSKIVPLLPRHTVYVEPFCGGAAIFFVKPWPPVTNNNHYREVLNDKDHRIVNLYRVLGTPRLREVFVEYLQLMPFSRERYTEAKARNKVAPDYTDPAHQVAAAIDYYVNVQQSFGNGLQGGWRASLFRANDAATWAKKVASLPDYIDRMAGVYVECDDALAVIKRWDSPQTLFYCDPPYPGSRQDPYRGYTNREFTDLCGVLDGCAGSFVLSNYDQPGVPDHWERFEFAAKCSAANGRSRAAMDTAKLKRTEVVWRMDRSDTARKEIQDIWTKWGWAKGQPMPGEKSK